MRVLLLAGIYRDVVLKPKVVVAFSIIFTFHETLPNRPQYMRISATNFGHQVVTINSIIAKNAPLWRRTFRKVQHAFITLDYTNIFSGRLPAKLEAGDKVDLLLPYDNECLLSKKFTHVGIADFYGRSHWAPKREFKKARKRWHTELNNLST